MVTVGMPQIDQSDPCPCDSGRLARDCCVFHGVAEPRETDTRPQAPMTGYAHPRCYARSLNDCSKNLTGEHYLTESLMLALAGASVWVRGFPWQTTTPQRVGVANLQAKILCGRHNNVLSPLDAQAVRLFTAIRAFGEDIRDRAGGSQVKLFPGADIERWLLKVTLGLACSGNAQAPDGRRLILSEDLLWSWSRTLFGRMGFPPTWGLYVRGGIGETARLEPGQFWVGSLTTDGELSGCLVSMAGVELVLAMHKVTGPTGAINNESIYRPNELLFSDPASKTERSLCIAWGGGRIVGGQVQFERRP
jgi:hypothetical protein